MLKVLNGFAFVLLLLVATPCYAESITGKVVKVPDGDSITLLVEKRQVRVRLYGIDAPELRQPYGKASKRALLELVGGKTVVVHIRGIDRYGRVLGDVRLGDVMVNVRMVLTGHAWVYRKYAQHMRLVMAEEKAREQRVGLWQDGNPIAPWDWRRIERARRR